MRDRSLVEMLRWEIGRWVVLLRLMVCRSFDFGANVKVVGVVGVGGEEVLREGRGLV